MHPTTKALLELLKRDELVAGPTFNAWRQAGYPDLTAAGSKGECSDCMFEDEDFTGQDALCRPDPDDDGYCSNWRQRS